MCHSILKPQGQEEGWGLFFLQSLSLLSNLHQKNENGFKNLGLK